METYFEADKDQFKAFLQLPTDQPLQMLNLLKFKEKVASTGLTGAEQYAKYMVAATPFFQNANAKILYSGTPQFTLIGPLEKLEWDKVLIVEYASKADFVNMVTQKEYPDHLRKLALVDARLIFCS